MKYLQRHPRRLVAAILLVGGVALALTLALSARSATASVSEGTVSFYKQGTFLGSTNVAFGSSLDVVWKKGVCSSGYGSPPVAFTWSGTTDGVTTAPVIAPCAQIKFPDDGELYFNSITDFGMKWTYKNSAGTTTSTSKAIPNPTGGTIGNVYLYKRTALSAYLITPGQTTEKVSIPKGADTIQFTTG